MDHNSGSDQSKPKTVCERFITIVRTTSPFRTLHRLNYQRADAAVARTTTSSSRLSAAPPHADRCARVSKNSVAVPVILDSNSNNPLTRNPNLQSNGFPTKPEEKQQLEKVASVLPIHGQENRVPQIIGEHGKVVDRMFDEYIDRAGRIIRCPSSSNVGIQSQKASGSNRDSSFNDRVSKFINGTVNKFHTAPSRVGDLDSAAASFKGGFSRK